VLARRPVPCGLLYGLFIYAFMNYVVIPLSAAPFRMPFPPPMLLSGLLVHLFLVGLPIALAASRRA
jgi:hypothetical protein